MAESKYLTDGVLTDTSSEEINASITGSSRNTVDDIYSLIDPIPNTYANSYNVSFFLRNYSYGFTDSSYAVITINGMRHVTYVNSYITAETTVYPNRLKNNNLIPLKESPTYTTTDGTTTYTYTYISTYTYSYTDASATSRNAVLTYYLYGTEIKMTPSNQPSITNPTDDPTYGVLGIKFIDVNVILNTEYTNNWISSKRQSAMYPDVEDYVTKIYSYAYNYTYINENTYSISAYIDIYDNLITGKQHSNGLNRLNLNNTFTIDNTCATHFTTQEKIEDNKKIKKIAVLPIINEYYSDVDIRNLNGNNFAYLNMREPTYINGSTNPTDLKKYGNVTVFSTYMMPNDFFTSKFASYNLVNPGTYYANNSPLDAITGFSEYKITFDDPDDSDNTEDINYVINATYVDASKLTYITVNTYNMFNKIKEDLKVINESREVAYAYSDSMLLSIILDSPMIPIEISGTYSTYVIDYSPKSIFWGNDLKSYTFTLDKYHMVSANATIGFTENNASSSSISFKQYSSGSTSLGYEGNDKYTYKGTYTNITENHKIMIPEITEKTFELKFKNDYKTSTYITITAETPGNSVVKNFKVYAPLTVFEQTDKNLWVNTTSVPGIEW